jgi:hypothetical protein
MGSALLPVNSWCLLIIAYCALPNCVLPVIISERQKPKQIPRAHALWLLGPPRLGQNELKLDFRNAAL